ncbi:hypothetical protein JCM19000A_25370 [Silvimonas sp. JCM 19000]
MNLIVRSALVLSLAIAAIPAHASPLYSSISLNWSFSPDLALTSTTAPFISHDDTTLAVAPVITHSDDYSTFEMNLATDSTGGSLSILQTGVPGPESQSFVQLLQELHTNGVAGQITFQYDIVAYADASLNLPGKVLSSPYLSLAVLNATTTLNTPLERGYSQPGYVETWADAPFDGEYEEHAGVFTFNLPAFNTDGTDKFVLHANTEIELWAAPVPEPETWALMGLGLAGIVTRARVKSKKDA